MKLVYRISALVAELLAGLATCIGCSKGNPEPAKPNEIHWHGAGGYDNTTTGPNEHTGAEK